MASYSDDFNRADDATGLGANWTEDNGDWRIVSNTARQVTSASAYHKVRYTAGAMASSDYYSQATIVSSDGGAAPGTFVRGASSSAITFYGYIFFSGDASYIVEITAGAEGILASGSAYSAGASIVARILAVGTALTGTRGGSADINTTDATLTGGAPGLCTYNAMAGAGENMDTWSAADNAASASDVPRRSRSFGGLIVR